MIAELPVLWLAKMRVQARRGPAPKLNVNSPDDLKHIPAETYATALTGRTIDAQGWMQCPFHRGGQERTPSFRVDSALWACYACEPLGGKTTMGGNIFDLAALLWGYGVPLVGPDYAVVRARLLRELS